jgi:hypothetical protein
MKLRSRKIRLGERGSGKPNTEIISEVLLEKLEDLLQEPSSKRLESRIIRAVQSALSV